MKYNFIVQIYRLEMGEFATYYAVQAVIAAPMDDNLLALDLTRLAKSNKITSIGDRMKIARLAKALLANQISITREPQMQSGLTYLHN